MCSHEILNYVTAETQRTSLILSQLERMKKGGEENGKNDERKLRDTKWREWRLKVYILNEGFVQTGGLHREPSLLLELATLFIYMLIGQR